MRRFSRGARLSGIANDLIQSYYPEEEAYHLHTKLMLKEPKIGGAFEWHQDVSIPSPFRLLATT